MDSLHIVAWTSTLERDPTMRCDEGSGTPRCSATLRCDELGSSGNTFALYVPLEAWGKAAEALGALHAGAAVALQGTLCWRKYWTKKGEEKGGRAVLVQKINPLGVQDGVV